MISIIILFDTFLSPLAWGKSRLPGKKSHVARRKTYREVESTDCKTNLLSFIWTWTTLESKYREIYSVHNEHILKKHDKSVYEELRSFLYLLKFSLLVIMNYFLYDKCRKWKNMTLASLFYQCLNIRQGTNLSFFQLSCIILKELMIFPFDSLYSFEGN